MSRLTAEKIAAEQVRALRRSCSDASPLTRVVDSAAMLSERGGRGIKAYGAADRRGLTGCVHVAGVARPLGQPLPGPPAARRYPRALGASIAHTTALSVSLSLMQLSTDSLSLSMPGIFDAPALQRLDLIGAPVCRTPLYRQYVIAHCSETLHTLDAKYASASHSRLRERESLLGGTL